MNAIVDCDVTRNIFAAALSSVSSQEDSEGVGRARLLSCVSRIFSRSKWIPCATISLIIGIRPRALIVKYYLMRTIAITWVFRRPKGQLFLPHHVAIVRFDSVGMKLPPSFRLLNRAGSVVATSGCRGKWINLYDPYSPRSNPTFRHW